MKKGQAPAYGGILIFILLIIFLTTPFIPQQKIVFKLENGEIVNLKFIETKETGAATILDYFKSKEISGTKVEIIGYNKTFEKCLSRYKPYNLKCIPSINETIWTTPNADIEVKVQLSSGEYVVRIISYIYDPSLGQMREKDREEFSFKMG